MASGMTYVLCCEGCSGVFNIVDNRYVEHKVNRGGVEAYMYVAECPGLFMLNIEVHGVATYMVVGC